MFKARFSTKVNAAANFAGSIWTALLGIAFVPVYLKYLGIESYGLIGIFNGIIAFVILLDFGLSPALNRELARLSATDDSGQDMRDLAITLGRLNWVTAVCIGLLFILLAPLIAGYWVQPRELSVSTVTQALVIMSVNVALQFSINFYTGGLMGLQKQVVLNAITIVCGTLRFGGAVLVIAYYSATIQAFLVWQGAILLVQMVLMNLTLNLSIPLSERGGRFSVHLLKRVWKFAAGITGITVVSLILTQTDKVVLSRMVSLEAFGYYTLATTMATMAINTVINALSHAVYPRFSQFVGAGDERGLSAFYHYSCQVAAGALFPIMGILAAFSREILMAWTGDAGITDNTATLLTIASIGTGLNGLMWLPYFLQLAHGWTKLTFYINVAAICVLIPLMIYGVMQYGVVGGAVAWLGLNAGYVLISPHLMHRRILKGEQWRWYVRDLSPPFAVTMALILVAKLLLPPLAGRIEQLAALSVISLLVLSGSMLATPAGRGYVNSRRKPVIAV